MSDEPRYRLVVLGSGKVGKSSIISRFLTGRFVENYRPTVEDLHCRTFHADGCALQVDILDTAGNLEFPAMRRLSISNAHAFLLVFAVDDQASFVEVRQLWDQIGEQRTNREEIPCVIVANKSDLVSSRLMVMERVDEWIHAIGIRPSASFVEASAKNNENIRMIFRKLYEQAVKIANSSSSSSTATDSQQQNAEDDQHLQRSRESRPSSQDPFLKRHLSANAARMAGKRSTGSTLSPDSAASNGGSNGGAGQKAEPGLSRSRSLIRRVRKPKVKDAPDPNVNDCVIS